MGRALQRVLPVAAGCSERLPNVTAQCAQTRTLGHWMGLAAAAELMAPRAFEHAHGATCCRHLLTTSLWHDAGMAHWIAGSPSAALRCIDASVSLGSVSPDTREALWRLRDCLLTIAPSVEVHYAQRPLTLPTWNGSLAADALLAYHAHIAKIIREWLPQSIANAQQASAIIYVRAVLGRRYGLEQCQATPEYGRITLLGALDLLCQLPAPAVVTTPVSAKLFN